MKDKVDKKTLQSLTIRFKRTEKKAVVMNKLKSKANATQSEILSYLTNMQIKGKVNKIKPLWITNVIAVKATKEVIETIAKTPQVESINIDEERKIVLDNEISWGVTKIRADEVWSECTNLKFQARRKNGKEIFANFWSDFCT